MYVCIKITYVNVWFLKMETTSHMFCKYMRFSYGHQEKAINNGIIEQRFSIEYILVLKNALSCSICHKICNSQASINMNFFI